MEGLRGIVHLRGQSGIALGASEAEPEEDQYGRHKRANRIEKRIPRRSRPAGHEGLMNLVERRISCCDRKCGQSPRPAPPGAIAAHTAKNQDAKNKILGEVRGLAYEMVNLVN